MSGMPGKYKNKHVDEYESDDLYAADTLIGRNRVPTTPVKKKTRPASANTKKKPPKRPVTPGKKKRAQSAPPTRSGHELWMNAVKNRLTVGLASNRHPQSPRHKSAGEYWMDTLRKTGQGYSTESTGMNTFNGKRPRDAEMPYLSTPSYLRQMVGTERPGKGGDPTVKASPGTPAYKSQEEYYEQVLDYKKQVGAMNQDVTAMRAKIRRLEEDNLKKEKEIDSLLNPHKSEELRRTLADKRPDSGSVIHSLKQKILKLETQLRDKETSYIKLQGDLKTTKIEELKQQLDVFYHEIVRLQHSKETGVDKSLKAGGRDGTIKMKALNETILRLTKTNEQLQSENRSLKEDLKMSLDDPKSSRRKPESARNTYQIPGKHKEYEDMNRKELLRIIVQLEKKLEKAERYMDGSSIVSYESKAAAVPGKVPLDGNLEERLDQLDKRESELLETLEKKNASIKHLTAEKNRWKKRCEELERLDHDVGMDRGRRESTVTSRPPSSRPGTGKRPLSARSDSDRPLSARDRQSAERSSRPPSARRRTSIDSGVSSVRRQKIQSFKENRSAKTIQKHWRTHQKDQRVQSEKVEHFRENRAAKKIQREWTGFQHKKHERESEEASELIRSALMGHTNRRQQMARYHGDDDDDYVTEDEEYNECANLIQSAMLGHGARKSRMRNIHLSSEGEEEDDDDDIIQTPKRPFSASRKSLSSSQRSNRPNSPALYGSRPQSGKSRSSSLKGSITSMPHNTAYSRGHTSNLYDDDDF